MQDIEAFMEGRNKELAGIAEEVLHLTTKRGEQEVWKLSIKKKRSGSCDKRGDVRSRFEDEKETAGSKGEGEKEQVRRDVLACQIKSRLSMEASRLTVRKWESEKPKKLEHSSRRFPEPCRHR